MKSKNPGKWQMLILPPGVLATLALTVLCVIGGTAYYELNRQKQEIEHIMHEEASLLIQSLALGAENAIVSYNEIKDQLAQRLLNNLRLLDRLDANMPLTRQDLTRIAAKNHLYRINVFDRNGKKIASSHLPVHEGLQPTHDPKDVLRPIFTGRVDSLVVGFKQSRFELGVRFAVAVKRSRGGAIATNVDAEELVALRRKIGVGHLIQSVGASVQGIAYIAWQDTAAIISATQNVTELDSIQSDPFLLAALASNETFSRTAQFGGRSVFEVAKAFTFQGTEVGLMRIGLRTDHLDAALARIRRRFFMLTGLLIFGALILFNLFISRRNETAATKAFRREQKFTTKILESMADAVIAVDVTGKVTLVNAAATRLFKLAPNAQLGRSILELLPGCDELLPATLTGSDGDNFENEIQCEVDGKQLTLVANVSLLQNDEGEASGAAIVLWDLTERRALETIVRRKEKLGAMGRLASGVAHEIRNPLNAIGILGQRLGMEFTPKQDKAEYSQLVQTIVSEVRRVNDIIQRFLKFARPPELNTAAIDFAEFFDANKTLWQGAGELHKVNVEVKQCPAVSLKLDKNQMTQVFLNLIRNAAEASSPNGQIEVSCYPRNMQVVIEIRDQGCGLTEDELARIFELYYTTKDTGTGMGLSIANQIVQAHGGVIEVASEVGKGSVFKVVLPV